MGAFAIVIRGYRAGRLLRYARNDALWMILPNNNQSASSRAPKNNVAKRSAGAVGTELG